MSTTTTSALRLISDHGQVPPWAGRTPRTWQAAALPVALDACRRRERGVIQAVMGSGKSIVIAEVCAAGRGRVLVTTPTIRLVEQLAKTIEERCPGEVGMYYTHAKMADCRITVCCLPSVPALLADPAWPGPPALWIADEAHREGDGLREVAPAIAAPRAIGFTATPYRAEEEDSLTLWDREIYSYGVAEALRDGVIVPFRQVPWTGTADVDFNAACVEMTRSAIQNGPGLANAMNIDDAEAFANDLNIAGIRAAAIHSQQPKAEQSGILESLRTGRLQVVVHVALLTEGVDYPWLRWLLMRRPVRSRVRFAQEVGRVLRSSPGKTEAILYDPHDLLGELALSYEAVIGLVGEEVEDAPLSKELRDVVLAGKDRQPQSPPHLKQLESWRKYLRAMYLAAMAAGLVECRVKSTRWRKDSPTEKQIAVIKRNLGGISRDTTVPIEHRRAMQEIGENAGSLSKGDASDLLSLLFLLADARRSHESVWGKVIGAA